MRKLILLILSFVACWFIGTDAICSPRYRLQETMKPFSNYTMGNKQANGVFKVLDSETGKILFFKRTYNQEIDATRRAGLIDFGNSPIIHIVKIADLDNAAIEHIVQEIGLTIPRYVKADKWLVTEKIPDGVSLFSVIIHSGHLGDGTRITIEEIDQIVRELKIMRNAGINHTDLHRNIILHREDDGKLQAYILDFENAGTHDVDYVESELEDLKERL